MADQKFKTAKAEDKKQDDENIKFVPFEKCCILRIGTNGLSLVGGTYESETAALEALRRVGTTGDFILLPVTTL